MKDKLSGLLRRLKELWHKSGYRVVRCASNENYVHMPFDHQVVPDFRVRARWDYRKVKPFESLAKKVIEDGRTLLSYDRLFVIYQCLQNVRKLNGNFAEVGTYRGGTSAFICRSADALKIKCKHHIFDTFSGHDERDLNAKYDHKAHRPGFFSDTVVDEVKNYLKPHNDVYINIGRFQDTCQSVSQINFSLVHLDVDLYEPTLFALDFFAQRMVSSGIIIIDDFSAIKCPGIEKAIESMLKKYNCFSQWYFGTEQYVLIRESDMKIN